jgi:hypothetical protein
LSGTPSSSPRRRQISVLVHHRSNPPPISLLSFVRASPDYLFRAHASHHFILLRKLQSPSSRGGHARAVALAIYRSKPHASLSSSLALFSREVRSPCFALSPGTFYLLNDARKQGITCSGHGATAETAVGSLFRPERRRLFPRSDLSRPF